MKKALVITVVLALLFTLSNAIFLPASAEPEDLSELSIDEGDVSEESLESNPVDDSALEADTVYGDTNGDKSIDMKDVLLIRKYMAGFGSKGMNLKAADANGDTSIDMKDVLLIRKYMAHMITVLGPDSREEVFTYYAGGVIESKKVYDGNHYLLESYSYDPSGELSEYTIFTNDSEGRPVTEKTYDDEDNLLSSYAYSYSEETSDVTVTEYDKDDNIRSVVTYNEDGLPLNELIYGEDNSVYHKAYAYDENGNMIAEKTYDGESETLVENYTYAYDENGNLILFQQLDGNDNLLGYEQHFYSSDDPEEENYHRIDEYSADDVLKTRSVSYNRKSDPLNDYSLYEMFENGVITSSTLNVYQDGVLVCLREEIYEEGVLTGFYLDTYMEGNKLDTTETYDAQGVIQKKIQYVYEDDDLIGEGEYLYEEGVLVSYEYHEISQTPPEETSEEE